MVIFIASAAHADPVPAAIIKWLKAYQTKSINLQEGVLSVRMDRPKVTRAMYETVVIDGVCMSLIDSQKFWGKANLKKLRWLMYLVFRVIYSKVVQKNAMPLEN